MAICRVNGRSAAYVVCRKICWRHRTVKFNEYDKSNRCIEWWWSWVILERHGVDVDCSQHLQCLITFMHARNSIEARNSNITSFIWSWSTGCRKGLRCNDTCWQHPGLFDQWHIQKPEQVGVVYVTTSCLKTPTINNIIRPTPIRRKLAAFFKARWSQIQWMSIVKVCLCAIDWFDFRFHGSNLLSRDNHWSTPKN